MIATAPANAPQLTYVVTAWDIKPSGSRKLVSVEVQAGSRFDAEQAGWLRLGTAPGTWIVEIVDVALAG